VNKYLHTVASGWIFIDTKSMSVFTVPERSQLVTLSARAHHLSLFRTGLIPNQVGPSYLLKIDLDFVFHLHPCLESFLFPSSSPIKTLKYFYSPSYTLHVPPILSSLIESYE